MFSILPGEAKSGKALNAGSCLTRELPSSGVSCAEQCFFFFSEMIPLTVIFVWVFILHVCKLCILCKVCTLLRLQQQFPDCVPWNTSVPSGCAKRE